MLGIDNQEKGNTLHASRSSRVYGRIAIGALVIACWLAADGRSSVKEVPLVDDVHADLDHAMRKAMQKIGMTATVPSFKQHVSERGHLLDRIAELEKQLQLARAGMHQ